MVAAAPPRAGADPTPGEVGLREVAELLDVHYMTAYRYVRDGRLPARKVGDEWRVRLSDLAAVSPGGTPGPGRSAGGPGVRTAHRERLEARLLAGDEPGAWAVVASALHAGAEPADVLNLMLAPALRSIGDRWAAGHLAIADEHRASAVATRVIARLGPRFVGPGRRRGTVVLGSVAGDQHQMPTSILADLLRGARFDVVDLGADTPAESFADVAISVDRLVAVGLCVTSTSALRSVPATVRALHRAGVDAPVVVGGGGVPDEATARSLGADHHAQGADAVVDLFVRLGRSSGARGGIG